MELKLTNVAKASLEELRLDYEDFLRKGGLTQWERNEPSRQALIDARPTSSEDFMIWVKWVLEDGPGGRGGPSTQSTSSTQSTKPTKPKPTEPEVMANGALALIAVATALLGRQIEALAAQFESEGGFTERLYRTRTTRRNS